MPVSYAEARNIVFLKSAVRGRSLFTEKIGTMKAIRIHNYGGPEVLKYEDAPRPTPQAGEVLVRVHAAGVNPIDWKVREGHMKDF
jgi:hypothetical protein